jgi:hypothetical protein
MSLFGRTEQMDIEMLVIDMSFTLKASLIICRSVLCVLLLCSQFLSLVFAFFTFGCVHQLQTAENTIFFVIGNIFHSGLQ